ncbi:MAG: hypothetical protein M1330_03625 [Armatimonadetes bacterium]|nr:hypothetical protein [Armatimonadota bacterium]
MFIQFKLSALLISTMLAPWKNGLPNKPAYFPIAVWLQSPKLASEYKAAGFTLYVGLWQGPTDKQLAELKQAGMPVICEQTAVGLAHRNDPIIVGWMQQDEPDNAQPVIDPKTGKQIEWGACVPPEQVVARYHQMKEADPTRPCMLNLGQGVANDQWYGRGPGANLGQYTIYVQGGDIISYDVYPVAGLGPNGANDIWYIAKGIERLRRC